MAMWIAGIPLTAGRLGAIAAVHLATGVEC